MSLLTLLDSLIHRYRYRKRVSVSVAINPQTALTAGMTMSPGLDSGIRSSVSIGTQAGSAFDAGAVGVVSQIAGMVAI